MVPSTTVKLTSCSERGWLMSDAPDEEVTSSEDDGESFVEGEDDAAEDE